MSLETLAQEVLHKEEQIEELRLKIKELFDDNQVRYVQSKNIQTPEIQDNYKKIDSTFTAKGKLEAEVINLKERILQLALGK